jgi:hypothetical protein
VSESFFGPTRANKSQQDVSWVPNPITNTVKGGSAQIGSAVNGPLTGSGTVEYLPGVKAQQQGFVGNRTAGSNTAAARQDDQQDVNFNPYNPISNTVPGGSAFPGSAIAGIATRAQAGNVSGEGTVQPGFVGTRTIPGNQS